MATSTTLALLHLQAMALDATYRALLAPSPTPALMADQKEVLDQIAADRAAQTTDEDLRRQWDENELEQISNDMQARGEE